MSIAIAGAGAWGTALGALLAASGERISIWAHEPEVAQAINEQRTNPLYLPGMALPPTLHASSTLSSIASANVILLACPAQHLRAVLGALKPAPGTVLIICAKGIERGSDALLTELIQTLTPDSVPAVLSGPSFAIEVAQGLPTAVTLAIADRQRGLDLINRLGRASFRPYWSDDLIGAQIGGAVKNVLAIACGIAEGCELGHSARAALITRGFAEMLRFALARGAKASTLSGLSGLGDLVLTCSSLKSRNYSLGVEIGRGRAPQEILNARRSVAEGAFTASALKELADAQNIEMPICAAVDQILRGEISVREAIVALMSRPYTQEH